MPLATASFPPMLFLIFFVLPIVLLLAILVGVVAFFYYFRKKPMVWAIGVAILILCILIMTWIAIVAGQERNYFMHVTDCDDQNVIGQTDNGELIKLKFSHFQNRQWGESLKVQTINTSGEQECVDISSLCEMIYEQSDGEVIRFETNGLDQIQRVWFLQATKELWAIYEITENSVTYKIAEWIDDTDSNTPFWQEETATNVTQIESMETIPAKILCYSELCTPDNEYDVYVSLSLADLRDVRATCTTDLIHCPYYSIANEPTVFDVTLDMNGKIILMTERYIP